MEYMIMKIKRVRITDTEITVHDQDFKNDVWCQLMAAAIDAGFLSEDESNEYDDIHFEITLAAVSLRCYDGN